MKKFLIVVDMQKDFVDGALGTKEACAIVENVVRKIDGFRGDVFVTYDTHFDNYLQTAEGRKLRVPHCIKGTPGWELDARVEDALELRDCVTEVEKITFGSTELPGLIAAAAGNEEFCIELVGLCTDICVVSNALLLKAHFPETPICVDASCCAGSSPQSHLSALETMKMCQIEVVGE